MALQNKSTLQFKLAMKCLGESHTMRRLSFISISLALITILAIGHYELSLTKEFNPDTEQSKLPNIFLIDLYKQQISDFQSMVSQEHNLAMMVRTRFSNNEHVSEYAKKLSNDYF